MGLEMIFLIVQIATIFMAAWILIKALALRKRPCLPSVRALPPAPRSTYAGGKEMTVYREGLLARALGRSRSDNPYARGSDNRYHWREGWSSIDDLDIDRPPEGWDEWIKEATAAGPH
jgi:hypothetical protein